MILEGIVRRFTALKGGKTPIDARFTHQESLAVAQVEPEGFEITRSGRRFQLAFNGTVPTGIAPVQALPTTAAAWVLWNADPYKSYILTTLGVMLFSGTPAAGGTVLGTIFKAPAQSGANATGLSILNMSGSAIGSNAVLKSAVTITSPVAPVWTQLAALPDAVDGIGGLAGPTSDIKGRIIIPPGQGFGLTVFAGAGTTPLFLPAVSWIELESDLE